MPSKRKKAKTSTLAGKKEELSEENKWRISIYRKGGDAAKLNFKLVPKERKILVHAKGIAVVVLKP